MRNRTSAPHLHHFVSACAAISLVAMSCSSDSDTNDPMTEPDAGFEVPDQGFRDIGVTDTGVVQGAEVDLTGTWASIRVASQCFDGPLGLDRVLFYWIAKHALTQTNTSVEMTTEICGLTLTPYQGSATTYPDEAIAAFDARGTTITLSNTTEGSAFVAADELILLGWEPTADPVNEMLPQDDMDDRLRDGDNDGNPGVSVDVMGFVSGTVYIASRNVVATSGVVESEDRVSGTVRFQSGQRIVGASAILLNNNSTTVTPDTGDKSSPFELVRLSGDTACADIVTTAAQLFTLTGTITESACPR